MKLFSAPLDNSAFNLFGREYSVGKLIKICDGIRTRIIKEMAIKYIISIVNSFFYCALVCCLRSKRATHFLLRFHYLGLHVK